MNDFLTGLMINGRWVETRATSFSFKTKSERDFAASQITDAIEVVKWGSSSLTKGNKKITYWICVHRKR